jgi:hypothetical protein
VRRIAWVVTHPRGLGRAISPWWERVGNPVRPVTLLLVTSAGI